MQRQADAVRLGVLLDGQTGTLGVHLEKRLELFQLALRLLGQDQVSRKGLQVFLGKLVHILQFRRPAFSFVSLLWRRILGPPIGGPFTGLERREIFMVLGLLPMLETNLRARISGMVTASDASQQGGGACSAQRVSRIGLHLANSETQGVATIPLGLSAGGRVLVFDWLAGIGGLRCALDWLEIPLAKVVVCESNQRAASIYRKRWGIDMLWPDILQVKENQIFQLISELPHVQLVIQTGGLPNWGPGQIDWGLLQALLRVQALVQACCEVRSVKHFGFFETAVLTAGMFNAVFRETKWHPHFCCSSGCSLIRRPGCYWTSSKLVLDQGMSLQESMGSTILEFQAAVEPAYTWLAAPWKWPAGNENSALRFPHFVSKFSRTVSSLPAAALREFSQATLRRWQEDHFRFLPQTYQEQFLVTDGVVNRELCAAEREILMGYPKSHTRAILKSLHGFAGEQARNQLICDAFHVSVVARILRSGISAVGWHAHLPSMGDVVKQRIMHLSELPCEKPPCNQGPIIYDTLAETEAKFDVAMTEHMVICSVADAAPEPFSQTEVALPHFFLRRAEYRGSDVRLDTGMLLHPERAPRLSMNPHLWSWQTVLSWSWQHHSHINLLELLACLKTFMWRSRSTRFHAVRAMHLLDSQVCLAVLTKGRSSSRQINRILQRFSSLILACEIFPLFAYIKSEFNPADIPSRHAQARFYRNRRNKVQAQTASK